MPMMSTRVLDQLFMHKSPIGKQCDNHPFWNERTHLLEHWLIVCKTDLRAGAKERPPCQRNGSSTINKRNANEHKGSQGGGIQGDIQVHVSRPILENCLHKRFIPFVWINSSVMEEAGKPAYPTGSILCATFQDFTPCL